MKRLFRPVELLLAAAALVMACSAFKAVSFATERKPNPLNYYSDAGVVVSVDDDTELVTVRTSLNLNYQFFSSGYGVGDMCSLLLDDMDTRGNPFDDVIIETRYIGSPSDYGV